MLSIYWSSETESEMHEHPSWQGLLRGKKISTNSDFKICYRDVYVIQKCKKKSYEAILETAANTHSLFSPNLVDCSACAPLG